MGYYTYVQINASNPHWTPELGQSIHEKLADAVGGFEYSDAKSGCWDLGQIKWYDDEMHPEMYAISRQFPDTLFDVYGDGDDAADLWTECWRNGRCQIRSVDGDNYNAPFSEAEMRLYNPEDDSFLPGPADELRGRLKEGLSSERFLVRFLKAAVDRTYQLSVPPDERATAMVSALLNNDADSVLEAMTGMSTADLVEEASQ